MILDYNKCQKLMDSFNNTIITEVSPIGYTSNEKLPIRHFTLGKGSKQVVVAGSQHANEIITVTFVLNLMSYLMIFLFLKMKGAILMLRKQLKVLLIIKINLLLFMVN